MLILKKTKTPRDIVEIISRKPQKTFCKKKTGNRIETLDKWHGYIL